MDLRLEKGTGQQRRWIVDAVAQCSFPIDKLSVVVIVRWVDNNNFPASDTRHPYMVTEVAGLNTFLISVANWADDATYPDNQGLPDPGADIYEFYKQSFVHELGHVAIDSTFNHGGADTDPRIGTMCGLFWRPTVDSGTGRRYGKLTDWDVPALAWADEIREAVAEVFKVAFFTGRLIFTNRTNWRIDAKNWAAFLALFQFRARIFESASEEVGSLSAPQVPGPSVTATHLLLPAVVAVELRSAELSRSSSDPQPWGLIVVLEADPGPVDFSLEIPGPGSDGGLLPSIEPPCWMGMVLDQTFFMGQGLQAGTFTLGLWHRRPAAGIPPDHVYFTGIPGVSWNEAAIALGTFGDFGSSSVQILNVGELFVEGYYETTIKPTANFPFGTGQIAATIAAQGQIRIG